MLVCPRTSEGKRGEDMGMGMTEQMAQLISEFAKHSPAAWEAMLSYHRTQAIATIVAHACALVATLLVTRFINGKVKERGDWAMGFLLPVSASAALFALGLEEIPSSWATAVSPERDAAIDVIKMAGLDTKRGK